MSEEKPTEAQKRMLEERITSCKEKLRTFESNAQAMCSDARDQVSKEIAKKTAGLTGVDKLRMLADMTDELAIGHPQYAQTLLTCQYTYEALTFFYHRPTYSRVEQSEKLVTRNLREQRLIP